MEKSQNNKPSRKKQSKAYLRFSNIGIQMGVTIFLGVWGGMKLDERLGTYPWLTVILSLSGVAAAMYLVFKELGQMSKASAEKFSSKSGNKADSK